MVVENNHHHNNSTIALNGDNNHNTIALNGDNNHTTALNGDNNHTTALNGDNNHNNTVALNGDNNHNKNTTIALNGDYNHTTIALNGDNDHNTIVLNGDYNHTTIALNGDNNHTTINCDNNHNSTTASNGDSDSSVSSESKRVYFSRVPSHREIRAVTGKVNLTKGGLSTYSTIIEPLIFQCAEFSHEVFNVEIQKRRIKCVLDNALEKLTLTMNLPGLVESNASLLRRYCTAAEVNTIMECYAKYAGDCTPRGLPKRGEKSGSSPRRSILKPTKTREPSSVTWYSSTSVPRPVEKPVKRSSTNKQRSHPQFATVIDILNKSIVLQKFAKEKMSGTESGMLFLEKFRILKDTLLQRMNKSLSSQTHKDLELRKIWVKNEAHKATIRQLELELERVMNRCNNKLEEKDNIIADYEKQIKNLRAKFEDQYNDCMKTSEAKMKKRLHDSVMAQDDTLTAIDEVQKKIDKLVPAHVEHERKMRMRRLRLEARLETQLTKFDDAMLKRQAECDELTAEINEEKQRVAKIQEKIDAQQEDYQTMVDEKMEEKEREINAKKRFILMVQCARRIQRYWRAYKARRDAAKAAAEAARKKAKKKRKRAKEKPLRGQVTVDPKFRRRGAILLK